MEMNATLAAESQTFSPRRFRQYFGTYIGINRRNLLRYLLIIGGAVLMVYAMWFLSADFAQYGQSPTRLRGTDPAWGALGMMFVVILWGVCVASGACMFGGMANRAKRTDTLMVPASQLEKFVTWFIIYCVGSLVAYVAIFYIIDIGRMLILSAIPGVLHTNVKLLPLANTLGMSLLDDSEGLLALIILWGGLFGEQALFAAGGIFFGKNQPIATFLYSLALGAVTSCAFLLSALVAIHSDYGMEPRFPLEEYYTGYLWVAAILSVAVISFLYWLSYKRLRQTESVHKW